MASDTAAQAASRPVTARAQAQALAGVGLWELDLRTGRLTVNDAARTLLGWAQPTDPTLRDFLRAVHPEDRQELRALTDRLVEVGEPFVHEHRAVLPGGQVLHLRASAAAERDGTGAVVALSGVALDVTDLQHAARAVGRERDLGQAILASLSEGYVLLAAGVIVAVNERLCEMTGFSERELVGTAAPYAFWPPHTAEAMMALRAALRAQGGGHAEVELQRKDGSLFPVAVTMRGLPPQEDLPLWIALVRDVSDERRRAQLLERQAASDPLTGVLNSRAFREELREAVRLAEDAAPLTLVIVDLDHFKEVNDRHGHAVGDQVLVAFAELVTRVVGRGTSVARVGGEEFALVMRDTDAAAARVVVERILAAVRSAAVLPDGRCVTVSAGISQLHAGMDDDGLFRLADAMLYEAKQRGRDQVC